MTLQGRLRETEIERNQTEMRVGEREEENRLKARRNAELLFKLQAPPPLPTTDDTPREAGDGDDDKRPTSVSLMSRLSMGEL